MNGKQKTVTILFFAILIVISCVSLSYGKYKINFDIIANLLFSKIGIGQKNPLADEQALILFQIRIPRVILVSLVGSSLAVSGAILQSVFKNPLVSPFIFGISSGASFGASIIIVFFENYNLMHLQASAFLFGIIAVFSVITLSRLLSNRNPTVLVLSGVIISTFFASLVSLLQYFSEDQKLQSILFWTFGSFNNSSWENVKIVAPINLVCIIFLVTQNWKIDVLSLGENESKSLGIETKNFELLLIVVTTLLASSVTAVCGPIGWVGLLIPHIVRLIGGANNFFVIINSFLLGAAFLQVVDLIARTIAPVEIPVGIITSIIGLPFFMYVVYRHSRR